MTWSIEILIGYDAGSDVIVVVEAADKSKTFQTEDSVPVSGATLTETSAQTQVHIDDQAGDEVGEPYGIEILKSTVYGGLVESITSLGIVTSAASAGSSPCKCSYFMRSHHGIMID